MKEVIGLVVLAIVGFGSLVNGLALSSEDPASRKISEKEWRQEVLDPVGPVLVDFWATWCGPCREMAPIVDALAKEYRVVKVDVDRNESLADHYAVRAVPTFLIFKDGKVARRITGAVSEETLRRAMKDLSSTR